MRAPAPSAAGELPLRRVPDYGHVFGPYPTPTEHTGDIHRQSSGVIDMRGASDWKSVFSVDCADWSWGQVLVTCEAQASPTVAHATDLPVWPWVEVRISAWINGQNFVLLEAAVGAHTAAVTGGSDNSPGPVFLGFAPGEVPDKIEVQARARRGGRAETAGDADEKLNLTASSRFHV